MKFKTQALILGAAFFLLSVNSWASTWTYARIPHIAVGGGYTSYLAVSDGYGTGPRIVGVYMYRDDGSPLYASVNGSAQKASFEFTLPALGEAGFALTSNLNLVGWLLIVAEGPGSINASLRFTLADGAGNLTDVVGILPSEPNRDWTLPVEKRNPTEYIGVALANPWNRRINLVIDLYQNGSPVPGALSYPVTLPALGHWAVFVHQLFPSASTGLSGVATLRISGSSDTFCAVALRADGVQYSSLPAFSGTQTWSWSYKDSSGVVQSGTWNLHFLDGVSFVGYEQNSASPDAVARLRGEHDPLSSYFMAESVFLNSPVSQGTSVFQGTPGKEGTVDVITGTRVTLNKDGTTANSAAFKATRTY